MPPPFAAEWIPGPASTVSSASESRMSSSPSSPETVARDAADIETVGLIPQRRRARRARRAREPKRRIRIILHTPTRHPAQRHRVRHDRRPPRPQHHPTTYSPHPPATIDNTPPFNDAEYASAAATGPARLSNTRTADLKRPRGPKTRGPTPTAGTQHCDPMMLMARQVMPEPHRQGVRPTTATIAHLEP